MRHRGATIVTMQPSPPHRCEFVIGDLVVRLQMTIAGTAQEIEPAVQRVMDVVRQLDCGRSKHFEIEFALREALANAIEHGCRHDPGKRVEIAVACDEARGLILVVKDPGPGFDPGSVPSPVQGERLYAEGGRGIYLINQLMDQV
ncbi:MAG: ATP-binding protein, partial [Acidobacteria bacterium]|nr:ATP-binding protein [Acidobacteriota bacterium]